MTGFVGWICWACVFLLIEIAVMEIDVELNIAVTISSSLAVLVNTISLPNTARDFFIVYHRRYIP